MSRHHRETTLLGMPQFAPRSATLIPRILILAAAILAWGVTDAYASTLFSEDFEGYTSFPSQIPSGDYVNPGLPKISEGANEHWYGVRFQTGNGTIDQDLAVQKFGGGSNSSHTGRAEDDAGLMLHINTLNMDSVSLSFDWRTFLAETAIVCASDTMSAT